ncbi:GAF domain-containing sensor histidine kinase [Pseudonocardia lacus]|uniref:GAF domain-containing sensor histidine kinase n=1 Tax=Pseudonocardia lacus TaxID=2835865 RepID=UPI001BDD587B|nr:GAF domain-containing sensor histidine kinase [Pseudonocardia lacus]
MADLDGRSRGDAARHGQRRLAAIARAASSVADAGSLRVTLDEVAREAARAENIAAVQILLVEGGTVRVVGNAGSIDGEDFPQRLEQCRRRGARPMFAEAFRTARPVVVAHRKSTLMADPAWEPLHEAMGGSDWDSLVAVPLTVRKRVLGVLNAYYAPGTVPDAEAVEFLDAMADLAAMAVDSADLLARSRRDAVAAERARLARDLHDSAVQHVFSMRMQAAALSEQVGTAAIGDPRSVRAVADELAGLAEHALADLRGLVLQLHPADLVELGLAGAVRRHAESVAAAAGVEVDTEIDPELDAAEPGLLPTEMQEDLFRIVQEALHNVVKHAAATRAVVRVRVLDDADRAHVAVDIDDDGVGTGGRAPRSGALGLVSMRERAQRWGGTTATGDAAPGFRVRVRVPVPTAVHGLG